MNYTSIEQSKKLLELGLSPESADMFYSHKTVFYNMMEHRLYVDEDNNWHLHQRSEIAFMDTGNEIPCWSLGALLELMPNYQLQTRDKGVGILFGCKKELKEINANTPLEAAYNMVVWLLENNYIKK